MTNVLVATVLLLFAFLPLSDSFVVTTRSVGSVEETLLFAEKRQPRRKLKKRRSRLNRDKKLYKPDELPSATTDESGVPLESMIETRPLIADRRREVGEDYWIDEEELKKANEREKAVKNRKSLEGEIPKEKLWGEVMAPYKQNWIGVFSVFIVTLVVLISQFPELLSTPSIQIPDL